MKYTQVKTIPGSKGRPILMDVSHLDVENCPVIIFCHGFKGYKDWGPFPLLSEYFTERGFVFISFNFSHNGGTIENPIDFPDLEAFGENNYSIELDDLGLVIDALENGQLVELHLVDLDRINLIGHSRGGGIAILKCAEDDRVSKLATLAAVSDFENRFPKGVALDKWKDKGIDYVLNGRTKQHMPMKFQMYENYMENFDRLDIPSRAKDLSIPTLIIHGSEDTSVFPSEGERLHKWIPDSELIILQKAGHTFGGMQPWLANSLPEDLEKALEQIAAFFTDVA